MACKTLQYSNKKNTKKDIYIAFYCFIVIQSLKMCIPKIKYWFTKNNICSVKNSDSLL